MANPLPIFVDNVHTIWGDNIGPWLTWPLVALMAVGAWRALRGREAMPRLMLAVVLVGFVVEAALLGNQRAHRYMHANMVAAFALAGVGLDMLLARVPGRGAVAALAVIAAVVTVEAAVSEVPHAGERGWLNARMQADVTQTMAEHFPMSADDMEAHVHGIWFGEAMGLGHLVALTPAAEDALPPPRHVMVMPSDLALRPHGDPVGPAYTVKGPGRDVVLYGYTPALDYTTLALPDRLKTRWRRARQERVQAGSTEVGVTVLRAGVVHVVWMAGRNDRDRCPIGGTVDGNPVQAKRLETRYSGLNIAALTVPAGALKVTVGPCRGVRFLDIW